MREFKGRMMTCACIPEGKARHTPEVVDGPDGSHCHYHANICMNCGTPKLTKRVTVWGGYLMDDEQGTLRGRDRANAIKLIKKHHSYRPR